LLLGRLLITTELGVALGSSAYAAGGYGGIAIGPSSNAGSGTYNVAIGYMAGYSGSASNSTFLDMAQVLLPALSQIPLLSATGLK